MSTEDLTFSDQEFFTFFDELWFWLDDSPWLTHQNIIISKWRLFFLETDTRNILEWFYKLEEPEQKRILEEISHTHHIWRDTRLLEELYQYTQEISHFRGNIKLLVEENLDSIKSQIAAHLQDLYEGTDYEDIWVEAIKEVIINSSDWTDTMMVTIQLSEREVKLSWLFNADGNTAVKNIESCCELHRILETNGINIVQIISLEIVAQSEIKIETTDWSVSIPI